ncbi:hypothetical protein MAFF211471_53780 (plasmid) [Ralstonia solanacearum]|nr:exported protein of unknown function [Ralstonia solanacearum SD54]BCL90290.1 hypothetical protein MAFF211471_53780 [Ralstonia solanacearum]BCN02854.1 hypothetical protein RPSA_53900 [Ralstonia solanacearum]
MRVPALARMLAAAALARFVAMRAARHMLDPAVQARNVRTASNADWRGDFHWHG